MFLYYGINKFCYNSILYLIFKNQIKKNMKKIYQTLKMFDLKYKDNPSPQEMESVVTTANVKP